MGSNCDGHFPLFSDIVLTFKWSIKKIKNESGESIKSIDPITSNPINLKYWKSSELFWCNTVKVQWQNNQTWVRLAGVKFTKDQQLYYEFLSIKV